MNRMKVQKINNREARKKERYSKKKMQKSISMNLNPYYKNLENSSFHDTFKC